MASVKYICEFVGGPLAGRMTLEEAEKLTDKITGRSENLTKLRAMGALVHRAELDDRPEFEGYCGPMWDGERPGGIAVLRYETWEVYNMMCD